MGALTSKKTQFNYRPWENKAIDSADSLDSFCAPIQVNIRGNNIIRVLPRLSNDKKFSWISDRTRFYIDGLIQQRIQTPVWRKHYKPYNYTIDPSMGIIKNIKDTSIFSVSWNFGFNLVKRHYTSSATAILGALADYPSTALVTHLFNNIVTDLGASRIPTSNLRHLKSFQSEGFIPTRKNDHKETMPLSLIDVQKPRMPKITRRIGYIMLNLNLRRFPLLQLYIQQLSSESGDTQNSFYIFGNNYSMWHSFCEPLGPITALPNYLAGKMTGVVQMEQFETVVFLNGRCEEASDFLTADDLAKLLLDNNWGLKQDHIYLFDLPNSAKELATNYMSIRNSFFPRWQPNHLNHDTFLFMYEAPHVATATYEDVYEDTYEILTEDDNKEALGIFVKFSHPEWDTAFKIKHKYLLSKKNVYQSISPTPFSSGTVGSLSSFKVSYGTHRSELPSRSDLDFPSQTPYEGTAHYGIDCFGRIAKFAFCYSGPTFSKNSIDMFTELANFLEIPFSSFVRPMIPNPLLYAAVSTIPFFVETPNPLFSTISDTYIYDDYRIDSITKASPTMALCSARLTSTDINFNVSLSNY